ncbi:hypothetical protein AZE42_08492 [Rhizopogon vesiculosus]|uniref:Uncharacterized protein n=1 Tax=Rhizopogon vesiculosus TaxID=180088 RepID=A0A1J8QIG8_9AGAM|nr:hypothetical protein AZE42_08492 [Rhizopogon vesiculosus]
MSMMMILQVVANLASPVGINRLLS